MANKLIIDIDGNAKELEKKLGGLGDVAKKAFSGVQAAGTKAVTAIGVGATAAIGAVAGLATAAVKSYAEYEQLVGGIDTLFKDSSKTVQDYAKNAYKTAQLSGNDYMAMATSFSASLLQGLGGDTKKAAQMADLAIIDMADNVNKMGSSVESVQDAYKGFAKQNYTMLDNLKLGYGGTKTEMIRLINDSGILQEKISDLDGITFDQMIQAIHEVQDEIGITGTSALEAKTTISGSAAMAQAAWANLVTGIADENADLDQLIRNFVDSVGALMGNLVPRVKIALTTIGKLAVKQFKKLTGIDIAKWAKPGLEAINQFGEALRSGSLTRGLKNLQGLWQGNARDTVNFEMNMKQLFGNEFGEKVANFVKKLKGLSDWVVEHKDAIIGAIKGMAIAFGTLTVIGAIQSLLTSLLTPLNLILLAAGLLGAAWSSNFLGIQETVSGFMKFLDPQIIKVKDYVKSLKEVFDQTGIGGVVTKIKDDIVGLIPQSVIDAVTSFKNTIIGLIPDSVKNAASELKGYFAEWAKTFEEKGLKAALTQAKADLTNLLPASVVTAISDVTTYMADMAKIIKEDDLGAGITKLREDLLGMIPQSVIDAWGSLKETVTTSMNSIVSTVKSEALKIKDALFGSFEEGPSLEEQFGRIAKMEGDGLSQSTSGSSAEAGIVGMLNGLKSATETTTTVINLFIATIGEIIANLATAAIAVGEWASKHPEFVRWFVETGTKVYLFGQLVLGLKGIFNIVAAATSPLGLKLMALAVVIATVIALIEAFKTAKFELMSGVGETNVYDSGFDWAGTGSFEQTQVIQGPNIEVKAGEVDTKPVSDSVSTALGSIDATTGVNGLGNVLKQALDVLTVESDLPGVSTGIEAGLGTVETNATQTAAEIVQGVGDELAKLNSDSMKKPVEDLNKSITDEFGDTYRELVGNSIVPDMVRDVNLEFEGWWATAEPGITSVTDGIIGKFTDMAAKLKEIVTSLTGMGATGIEAAPEVTVDPGLGAEVGGGLLADLFKPISEETLTSYATLATNLGLVSTAVTGLNTSLGSESGLSFILSDLSTFITETLTATFTDFATLIGIAGTFGLALEAMNRMFSTEGGTTSTLEILGLINDFIAIDLTTTLTTFAALIILGGTFGAAVEDINRRLSTEGSTTSMLQVMQQISAYIAGDFTKTHQAMADYWNGAYKFAIDAQIWLLWTSPNSLYNAYGAIFGVLEDIYEEMAYIVERIRSELIPAFKETEKPAGIFQGAVKSAANAANGLGFAASAAAAAVRDLISAMSELNGMGQSPSNAYSDLPTEPAGPGHAWGGWTSMHGLTLVGERGPELISTSRMMNVIRNDEIADRLAAARDTVRSMTSSRLDMLEARRGNQSTTNNKEYNFNMNGDVYGESHLRQLARQEAQFVLNEAEFHGA